jgi:hypothetical protein
MYIFAGTEAAPSGSIPGDDLLEVMLPVLEPLDLADDRVDTVRPVNSRVAAGGRLALGGLRLAALPSHGKESRQMRKRCQYPRVADRSSFGSFGFWD